MKHYQKIATVLVRLLGFGLFIYGSIYLIWFVSSNFTDFTEYYVQNTQRVTYLFNGLLNIIIGITVFLASKPIGKIVGRGLDD